jgi:hypothetical protein
MGHRTGSDRGLSTHQVDAGAARLLLLSAPLREARRRPDIVQEFRARIEALARERALSGPINALAERVTAAILDRVRRH